MKTGAISWGEARHLWAQLSAAPPARPRCLRVRALSHHSPHARRCSSTATAALPSYPWRTPSWVVPVRPPLASLAGTAEHEKENICTALVLNHEGSSIYHYSYIGSLLSFLVM